MCMCVQYADLFSESSYGVVHAHLPKNTRRRNFTPLKGLGS